MNYSELSKVYQELESTSKRLEKTYIISELLSKTKEKELEEVIYLLQGKVFPKWDERKLGVSSRLILKAINAATGIQQDRIESEWVKKGDLGLVVESLMKKTKQQSLFSQKLTTIKVYENIRKLAELEGKGTVSRKIQYITELLTSAEPNESKFIVRTIIEDLRIGVAEGIIKDAIAWTYLPKLKGIFFRCNKCKKL